MIYYALLEELNAIKIGYARRDVKERIRDLQTSLPTDLTLLGFHQGSLETERRLHQRFKHIHLQREWFRKTEELLTHIEAATTFQKLLSLEPRLEVIYEEALSCDSRLSFCANRVWYGRDEDIGLRGRIIELVGYSAINPLLRSSANYDIVYQTCWNVLPVCSHLGDCTEVRF